MLFPRLPVAIILFLFANLIHLGECIAQPEAKPLKPSQEWKGSNEEEGLAKNAPEFISSSIEMEKIWKLWNLGTKVPKIDFTKEILMVATTRGSQLRLSASLDNKGNVQNLGIATRDLRPGFRYMIIAISKEGVKTINGKPLAEAPK